MAAHDGERTAEEQEIIDLVARREGREWAEAHAELILEQARSVGELVDEPPVVAKAGAPPQEPDPDDKRVRLHLARFPTLLTIEQVVALTKAITGRDPTPEERAEALRILDEAARRQDA